MTKNFPEFWRLLIDWHFIDYDTQHLQRIETIPRSDSGCRPCLGHIQIFWAALAVMPTCMALDQYCLLQETLHYREVMRAIKTFPGQALSLTSASLKCGSRQSDHTELQSMHLTANQHTASFVKKVLLPRNHLQNWTVSSGRVEPRWCSGSGSGSSSGSSSSLSRRRG